MACHVSDMYVTSVEVASLCVHEALQVHTGPRSAFSSCTSEEGDEEGRSLRTIVGAVLKRDSLSICHTS